ncbi:MAG: PAS domain S-box protein [Bacteroidetes bacterium]|nr:PAS domain S-box protein [Bacteroidota bacterium]
MLTSHRLTLIITIAILSVTFSLYRISIAEKELAENIQRLNIENERYTGIEEEIYHLDEILTTSAYMYIYTGSEKWKGEYETKRERLTFLLNTQLRFTSDDSIRSYLKELASAQIKLIGLENEAIRLKKRDEVKALALLDSKEYWNHKMTYSKGVADVSDYIRGRKEKNSQYIDSWIKENQFLYLIILLINLVTWLGMVVLFHRSSRISHNQNKELNRINKALNESLKLERIGSVRGDSQEVIDRYLKFLKQHLPFEAFYFVEQDEDLVSVRSAINNGVVKSGRKMNLPAFDQQSLQSIIKKVVENNESLGLKNGDVLDHSRFIGKRNKVEGVFTPIKTDNGHNTLLYVDPGEMTISESDIGILHAISNQLRISLDNAQIYTGLEKTIHKRTKELKDLNAKLKKKEKQLRNVFENTQTGVVASNADHKYTMVNTQFSKMLGYSKRELMKMKICSLLVADGCDKYMDSMTKIVEGRIKKFTMRLEYKNREGKKITTLTRQFGVYDEAGHFVESNASILDITDQIEASKKLMESIIETENLERTRIATTLHDSIGQNLTSLHLMLTSLAKSKHIGKEEVPNVRKVIEITKNTITETRQISHNLMPKYITRFGLNASVENLVQDLNATKPGTNFSLYHNFEDDILSITEQIAIYRIIQESINNILKYAVADNVDIQLVKHGNTVTVLVDDDGVGFDIDVAREKESLGLKSLQNRAQSISADLEIDSKLGRGTTISVQISV